MTAQPDAPLPAGPLKACPFCGRLPRYYRQAKEYPTDPTLWTITCCVVGIYGDEQEVVQQWNTRVSGERGRAEPSVTGTMVVDRILAAYFGPRWEGTVNTDAFQRAVAAYTVDRPVPPGLVEAAEKAKETEREQ